MNSFPVRKHNPLNCILINPAEPPINCNSILNVNQRERCAVRSPSSSNVMSSTSTLEIGNKFQNTRLKIAHLNIRSLNSNTHLTQLRDLTRKENFDILTISETWLNNSVTFTEVGIDGYNLFRLDRLNKRGGGVCTYVRKELKSSVLKSLSFISEENFHQLWINVQCQKSKSLIICVTYRPPDCPLHCFEHTLKPNYMEALVLNKPIVILGDLNCDGLKDNCVEYKTMEKFLNEMNLTQLIKSPTRITDSTQSLLDVILVSSKSIVYRSGVLLTSISDHLLVYAELKIKSPKQPLQYITARSFKNYVPNHFAADLADKSDCLVSIFDGDDVNVKLNILNSAIQSTLDAHAPIKTIKIRNRPCPFITQDLRNLMKERDRLHQLFLRTRDIIDWDNYKSYRNNVKRELKKAENEYNFNEVRQHKDNPESLWKIVNRLIPSKGKERQIYKGDHKSLANDFNQFFSSVGENAARASSHLADINNINLRESIKTVVIPEIDQFKFRAVTCHEVRRVVLSLPLNKSAGPDKINPRIIRDCLPVILGPLTEIINCSFRTSTFPLAWKKAEIIPVYKEGDHEVASNNRPVSLLAVASKVCERLALEQFSCYLTSNNRLSSHQSGNKKLHSTETLNVFITDTILKAMDKKKLSALVLLDLSKAFDSINHQRLLHKLSNVGASKSTLNWFRSYLTDRFQSTRINSTLSDPLPIIYGVPQGAILSPLLFCIYLNDLPCASYNGDLESYVDDTKTLLSFPLTDVDTGIKNLEEDLYKIASWCCENNLLVNPDKTKFMIIGTRQLINELDVNISISFMGKILEPVDFAKDLGLLMDSHLSYDKHISNLVSSCLYKLCQINRVKNNFDKGTLTMIITSLVISKLLYCSTVWSNTTCTNIKKLQSIQNFACKIIAGSKKYDHVSPLLRDLGWLSVDKLLYLRDAVMTFKCMNNLAPKYLCDMFEKRSCIHNRSTRNCNSIQIPLFKTTSGQRSFAFRGASIWNNLDTELKKCTSLKSFKSKLKDHLLST